MMFLFYCIGIIGRKFQTALFLRLAALFLVPYGSFVKELILTKSFISCKKKTEQRRSSDD